MRGSARRLSAWFLSIVRTPGRPLAKRNWAAVFVVILGAVLAACGSGGGSGSGSVSSGPLSLKLELPTAAVAPTVEPIIGLRRGIFQKLGLNLTIQVGAGSNANGLVVSGDADIALATEVGAVQLAAQGKDTTSIFNPLGSVYDGAFVGAKGIATLDALRDKKNCRIATRPAGTGLYGYAQFYNKTLHLGCTLVSYGTTPLSMSAVVTGRADAGTADITSVPPYVQKGQMHLIIDTLDQSALARYHVPADIGDLVYMGVTSNLNAKHKAVELFLKGLSQTDAYLRGASPAEVADQLRKWPDFAATSTTEIATEFKNALPLIDPGKGHISETSWTASLKETEQYAGLAGFDASDPAYVYSKRVDNSFYQNAIGAP